MAEAIMPSGEETRAAGGHRFPGGSFFHGGRRFADCGIWLQREGGAPPPEGRASVQRPD